MSPMQTKHTARSVGTSAASADSGEASRRHHLESWRADGVDGKKEAKKSKS